MCTLDLVKYTNKLKKMLLLLFPFTLLFGCFNFVLTKERNRSPAPGFIVAKSDSIIISKTGSAFFHKYIKYIKHDTSSNQFNFAVADNHFLKAMMEQFPQDVPYNVLYRLQIPGKPWINEPIRFYFDSTGNIIRPVMGIQEYLLYPDSCTFEIDSTKAINIAKKAGFEKGIKPWEISFGWSGRKINKYTWVVKNYINSFGCGEGHLLWIDASSGSVLQLWDWSCTP